MRWVVLSKIFMRIGVRDGECWVANSKIFARALAIREIPGPTVELEVGRFVDQRAPLGSWVRPQLKTKRNLSY